MTASAGIIILEESLEMIVRELYSRGLTLSVNDDGFLWLDQATGGAIAAAEDEPTEARG